MSKDVGDLYLAEYNSLRQEQMQRIQTQIQSFNFLLIVTGAAITAIIASASAENNAAFFPWVVIAVVLLLPMASCPLGYMFFDNEIMIHAIGSYLYYNRRPSMLSHFGDDRALGRTLGFDFLPRWTDTVFPWISKGRWVLFCLPTFLPVILFPVILWRFWPFESIGSEYSRNSLLVAVTVSFLVDVAACVLLFMAIIWTRENDKLQADLIAGKVRR
jgi:hypothetical protein